MPKRVESLAAAFLLLVMLVLPSCADKPAPLPVDESEIVSEEASTDPTDVSEISSEESSGPESSPENPSSLPSSEDAEIPGPFSSGFVKTANRYDYPNQVLQSFDYAGVELTNSPLKTQYSQTLDFYLSIPNDDILQTVRRRAGVHAPGQAMGGWYDGGGFCGSTFGQWLSAFARFYAATGDERIKEKAQYLLNEWGKLIEDNGFFYFNPTKNANTWHYTYDKMVLGLTDMYVYMQDDNAKTYLSKITNFAEKYLMRHRTLPTKNNIVGEKGSGIGDNEWYTLSENLYRAYLATGDKRYKDFAAEWHYDAFWDALRSKNNAYWTGIHAYSHVNSVGGAAMLYMITGNEKYKQTLTGFYDSFKEWEIMSNGAYGIGEGLRGSSSNMANSSRTYPYTFETPCCSWATFKLTRYLIGSTGDATYGDWGEKVLYNGIFSALPMKDSAGKRGQTFYYARYTQKDASKTYYDSPWPCCSGTYALAVSEYVNQIYYKNSGELYVNLFVPSKVTNTFNKKSVTLTQTTSFPESDTTSFTISTKGTAAFNLKVRLPEWVDGEVEVTVNGVSKEVKTTKGWLYIGSSWKDGDTVSIRFPMAVDRGYFDPKTANVACFMYGPVMLAAEGIVDPLAALDPEKKVSSYFTPREDTFGFVFRDEFGATRNMVPFYAIPAETPYCVNYDVIE